MSSRKHKAKRRARHGVERLENRLLMALMPVQVTHAYGIDQIMYGATPGNGAGQTIAIIDPGDDSALVNTGSPSFTSSDLYTFDHTAGINLPDPPSFTVIGESGGARPSYIGISTATESGTTVTVNTTSADGLSTGNTVTIAEAGVPQYDGQYKVLSTPTSTQFTCVSTAMTPPTGLANSTGGTINNPVSTGETTLDVEWAHSIAPAANIELIELTNGLQGADVANAVNTAVSIGASVVSQSFGFGEFSGETGSSTSSFDDGLYSHAGMTFIASTGDNGQPAAFPSYSSNVLAIGATDLTVNADNSYGSETGWSNPAMIGGNNGGSAGGISAYESQPSYQQGTVTKVTQSTTFRTNPDVSFVGGSQTPVLTYDSIGGGYFNTWGTSVSAPCWAGLIAIADQGLALQGKPLLNSSAAGFAGQTTVQKVLYDSPLAFFHDITSGFNGFNAVAGYDLVTGIGTPLANLLVPALAGLEPVSVTAPSNQSSAEGASHGFSLGSYIDYGSGPVSYDVNWGDGTPDTIVNGAALAPASVSALHSYGEEGTYTLKFTVTDQTTLQAASYKISINVTDPPVIPTGSFTFSAVEGALSASQTVATFTDPGGAEPNPSDPSGTIGDHYTTFIDWGDGSPDTFGNITYSGAPGSTTGVFTVSGAHTYGEEGNYTISVAIFHELVPSVMSTSSAAVSDPSVSAIGTSVTAIACLPLTGLPIASFTDPGGAEPNIFDFAGTINNHYKVDSIDWGDATPLDTTTGTLSYGGPPDSKTSPFTVSGSHTYASEGVYTVKTTIDHEGVVTAVTSMITVKDNIGLLVLDPSGNGALTLSGSAGITVNNCGAVVVNSTSTAAVNDSSSNLVSAMDIDVTGGVTGNGKFSSPIGHEPPTVDPIALPLPIAPAVSFSAVNYNGATTLTLLPGTYLGGIHDNGPGNIILSPGVYYLQGGGLRASNTGSIIGNGVLIINAPIALSDGINVSGPGSIVLSADPALPAPYAAYQGITLMQDPASTVPVTISGSGNLTMDGALYAPKAKLVISGSGTLIDSTDTTAPVAEVIVADVNLSGSANLTINADAPASNPPSNTPLLTAANVSVALSTFVNPAVPGQPLTLTAIATSIPGPPQGSIDFFDTTTHLDLGSVTLSGGVASVTTSALTTLGNHVITATYFANSPNFAPPATPPALTEQLQSEVIEGTQLFVGGNPNSNTIQLQLQGTNVLVNLHDGSANYLTPLAGLTGLVVYGQGNNEHITVDSHLLLPAVLYAGNGTNAQIQGGGGPTIEVGGSGGSHLQGGQGRNILIAGSGGGQLQGGPGGSILIGGFTDSDSNLPALEAALAEWSSSDTYAVRVASPALSIFSAATVHSDGLADQLQGGGGNVALDWFFVSTLDQVNGGNVFDTKVNIT